MPAAAEPAKSAGRSPALLIFLEVNPATSMYVSAPLVRMVRVTYAWYMSITAPVAVSEARRELASIIDRVRDEHAPIYLCLSLIHI